MVDKEPEFVAPDGTVRKLHYGKGRQPWDDIVEAGWGPVFAAGNALKYVRRYTAKNGQDDLEKGRWYYARLCEFANCPPELFAVPDPISVLRRLADPISVLRRLRSMLEHAEIVLLEGS